MFKKLIKTFTFLFVGSHLLAQVIESDSIESDDLMFNYSNDEIYFSIEPAYSYREVMNNPKFITGNAEELEGEESVTMTSFTLGLRKSINKNLYIDIGVGFSRNGEFYNFETADSLFEYKNTYRHIAFPFHFAYSTGENVSFYAGLGIRPQAFLSIKRDLRYTTTISSFEQEEEIITREGYNLFILDASFTMGVKIPLGDNAGLHLLSIGNYQLNNTYDSMSNIIRRAYRIGGAVGVYFKLQ